MVDTDGSSVSSATLLQAALNNLTESDNTYAVRCGSKFVNEYGHIDPDTGLLFDGGLENPNHLLGAFPWLFPYSAGGFKVDRPRPIPYEKQVR